MRPHPTCVRSVGLLFCALLPWLPLPAQVPAQAPGQVPAQTPTPTATPSGPAVGAKAPPFRLNDHTGKLVAVGGDAATWTVLAFYPKAATPGCTKEVCSLRDAGNALEGVRVLAVSLDDVQAVAAFHASQKLNFPLLSDPDGSVAAKYGVLMAERPVARRVTFVVDDRGVVRHVDDHVDVSQHGPAIAALIARLRG